MDTRELSEDVFEELTSDVFHTLEDLLERQCKDNKLSLDPVIYSLCRNLGVVLSKAGVEKLSDAKDIVSGAVADGYRAYNLYNIQK